MEKKRKKKKICLEISEDLYKELNQMILNKFGNVFGHIGATIEESIELWLNKQIK